MEQFIVDFLAELVRMGNFDSEREMGALMQHFQAENASLQQKKQVLRAWLARQKALGRYL